jgi:hypothetical protein
MYLAILRYGEYVVDDALGGMSVIVRAEAFSEGVEIVAGEATGC